MTAIALARQHNAALALGGAFLVLGGIGWCFLADAPVYLFAELWAGVLIALSVGAYALGYWPMGVTAGLAALFFRELALAYCAVAVVLAWWQGRHREVVVWLVGFVVYAAFMAFHIHEVLPRLPAESSKTAASWIQFRGVTFLLETGMPNLFLGPNTWWLVAFIVPLGLLGLAAWPGPMGTRCLLTVLAYFAAFSVVGQWFNSCWGLLYLPILMLGLAWTPLALRDLWKAAWSTPLAAQASAPESPVSTS
jgi:hypothetical protein